MPLATLRRTLIAGILVALLLGATAGAALVQYKGLILRADGGFQPRTLPRHRYAPINFEGHFDISAKGGGKPPALEQAVVEFDRDGRLDVAGLPTCAPEKVAEATTAVARRVCASAIVGTGVVGATISGAGGNTHGIAPLTIFNGPRVGGDPTVILHTHTVLPEVETYAIVAPIEQHPGPFRYRVTIDVPPIAGGAGSITEVKAKIGREFEVAGKKRSYVAARCTDNVLETHGRFTFGDGTVIEGSVEKYCRVK